MKGGGKDGRQQYRFFFVRCNCRLPDAGFAVILGNKTIPGAGRLAV